MVEVFSLIGLLSILILGKITCFVNTELVNSSFAALLIFIIFSRCFVTINSISKWTKNCRLTIEIKLMLLVSVCLELLFLHFNGCFINDKILIVIINIFCLVIFIGVKVYSLKHNFYGRNYIIWHIIDSLLIVAAAILNFYLSIKNFSKGIIVFLFVNIVLLALVNKHINHNLNYWLNLELFKINVRKLILTGEEIKLIEPPEKNLERDFIFSKCVYILDDAFIRVFATYKLFNIVKKELIFTGKDKKYAHLLASRFLGILSNNLMKRKFDNIPLPYFLIKYYYKIERLKAR